MGKLRPGTRSASFAARELFAASPLRDRTAIALATWFGTGLLPLLPGTFGTLATIPALLALEALGGAWRSLFLPLITGLAIWSAGRYEKRAGKSDPAEVVIDEAAGFTLTMFLFPLTWPNLIIGFLLFRGFDILKPFPIRKLEGLPGGWGIVGDDLAAGLYALCALRVVAYWLS